MTSRPQFGGPARSSGILCFWFLLSVINSDLAAESPPRTDYFDPRLVEALGLEGVANRPRRFLIS
jgi:hypothetical protein